MGTKKRRRKRIEQDSHPTVRLEFPDGTSESFARAFILRIPWQLGYQRATDADGRFVVQAVYRAPKPYQALVFVNDSMVTPDQIVLAQKYFKATGIVIKDS